MSDGPPSAEPRSGYSNLQLRIMSALVLGVAVLGLAWLGGPAFRILAVLIGALMLHEWTTMSRARAQPVHFAVLWAGYGVVAALMLAGYGPAILIGATVIAALAAFVSGRVTGADGSGALGLVYAALSAVALAGVRGDNVSGLAAILFLFAIVWATDIAAYFVGRAIGGPKLAPAISPGKTWSGAVGGASGGVLAGLAVASVAGFAGIATLLLALVLSAVSQVGDLFESAVKRRFGAKDSGAIIPGHGGVMDRVDGLVAAAIALYLLVWLAPALAPL